MIRLLAFPKAFLLPLILLIGAGPALAGNTGSLRVVVSDPDGRPVEGADIGLTDPSSTSFHMAAVSDKRGRADLLGLQPRAYVVSVGKEGFLAYETNFMAHAGERTVKEVTLRPMAAGAVVEEDTPGVARVVEKGTDPAAVAYNEAARLYGADRNAEALAALRRALMEDPGFGPARSLEGIILEEEGRCEEAVPLLKEAVSREPDRARHLASLIRCLERIGLAEEAASFKKMLSASERSKSDLYNEAIERINEGKDAEAAPLLEEAIARDEAFAPAQYQYGLVLFRRGDVDGALARLKRYLQIEPEGEFAADARGLLEALEP